MQSYTWRITDPSLVQQIKTAKPCTSFRSQTFRLFNFPWEIDLRPNGTNNAGKVDIYLCLCSLSPNAVSVSVKRKYTFEEGAISHECQATITHDTMYAFGWPNNILKTKDIQKYKQFTFKVDITLYSVFDCDGNDIRNKYLQNDERKTEDEPLIIMRMDKLYKTVQAMQQKMNDLELRLNEEQKNNSNDKFEKQIELMQKQINKLSLFNKINPEQQKLKIWFESTVQLPEYYDIFIENGIEDLATVSLLTMETLKGMGVEKIGHQMKLLHQIAALKHKSNNENDNVVYEGVPEPGYT